MLILFYLIVTIIFNLVSDKVLSEQDVFLFYSILNIVIFIHFTWYTYKKDGVIALLHPTVLGSFYFFVLCFGVTNFSFITWDEGGLPPSSFMTESFGKSFTYANELMFWSIMCHLAMWFGSQFLNVDKRSRVLLNRYRIFRELPKRNEIKIKVMVVMYVITVLIKIFMIFLGVYGFTQNHLNSKKYDDIVGVLKIITASGQVYVFLIAIYLFKIKKHVWVIFCIGLLEAFFGLLAGFKSQLFMPFLIFSFSYFYVNRKVNYLYLVSFLVSLNLAYAIVEPFRKQFARQEKIDYSIGDILDTYVSAQENKQELTANDRDVSTMVQVSDRLNLTYPAVLSYRYLQEKGEIEEFRIPERLYLLPFIIFVPKSVWHDKPDADLGNLAYKKIMGGDADTTSVDLSSIAFSFLGWGTMWVVIPIFIMYGVIQSFFCQFFYNYGLPGLILFLSNLTALYTMFEFSFFLVATVRAIIIGLVVQYFLLNKGKPKSLSTAVV